MNRTEAIHQINELSSRGEPFLFIVDYPMQNIHVWPVDDVPNNVFYQIGPYKKYPKAAPPVYDVSLKSTPIDYLKYKQSFDMVQHHLQRGDTYLLNLTQPTPIELNYTLDEIFISSSAYAKLLFSDEFVVFSPEKFIEIKNDTIATYPMKGTIDATLPGAADTILSDKKEASEHATIVDLLRNDLSRVAGNVRVTNYRYIDTIVTPQQHLLQVSSAIEGKLSPDYSSHLGNLLFELLPAGSISGAPKAKTLEIIAHAEGYDRGYYTGVFGIFDGSNLFSAVMIRFIEKTKGGFYYKSGGGVTAQSICRKEYNELIQKIYVPVS